MIDVSQLFPYTGIKIFLDVFLYFVLFSSFFKYKVNKLIPLFSIFASSYAIVSIITLLNEYPAGLTRIIIYLCTLIVFFIFFEDKVSKKLLYFLITFGIETLLAFITDGLEFVFLRDLYEKSETVAMNKYLLGDFLFTYITPIIIAIPLSGIIKILINKNHSFSFSKNTFKLLLLPLSQFSIVLLIAYLVNNLSTIENLDLNSKIIEAMIGIFVGLSLLADWFILITAEETEKTFENNLSLENELAKYEVEYSYIKQLEETNNSLHKIRHDIVNQNSTVLMLLQSDRVDEAIKALTSISHSIETSFVGNYCENSIINAILKLEASKCKSLNITPNIKANASNNCSIDTANLCSLLLNLIDNAIEATANSANKSIEIEIFETAGNLIIHIENTYIQHSNNAKTTKADKANHGFGTQISESIVNKYSGTFSHSQNKGIYSIEIVLPF